DPVVRRPSRVPPSGYRRVSPWGGAGTCYGRGRAPRLPRGGRGQSSCPGALSAPRICRRRPPAGVLPPRWPSAGGGAGNGQAVLGLLRRLSESFFRTEGFERGRPPLLRRGSSYKQLPRSGKNFITLIFDVAFVQCMPIFHKISFFDGGQGV